MTTKVVRTCASMACRSRKQRRRSASGAHRSAVMLSTRQVKIALSSLLHRSRSGCSPWLLRTGATKPFESSAHAAQIGENKESMTKKSETIDDDDPLDHEIDFSNARPNPFARDYGRNRNLRILAPDLLKVFPDSDSVN